MKIYYALGNDGRRRKFPTITAAHAHARLCRDYVSVFRVHDNPKHFLFADSVHLGVLTPSGEFKATGSTTEAERAAVVSHGGQLAEEVFSL